MSQARVKSREKVCSSFLENTSTKGSFSLESAMAVESSNKPTVTYMMANGQTESKAAAVCTSMLPPESYTAESGVKVGSKAKASSNSPKKSTTMEPSSVP